MIRRVKFGPSFSYIARDLLECYTGLRGEIEEAIAARLAGELEAFWWNRLGIEIVLVGVKLNQGQVIWVGITGVNHVCIAVARAKLQGEYCPDGGAT